MGEFYQYDQSEHERRHAHDRHREDPYISFFAVEDTDVNRVVPAATVPPYASKVWGRGALDNLVNDARAAVDARRQAIESDLCTELHQTQIEPWMRAMLEQRLLEDPAFRIAFAVWYLGSRALGVGGCLTWVGD